MLLAFLTSEAFLATVGTLTALGTVGNMIMYTFGIFRRLENKYQADASATSVRISKLEGQVDSLINSSFFPPPSPSPNNKNS